MSLVLPSSLTRSLTLIGVAAIPLLIFGVPKPDPDAVWYKNAASVMTGIFVSDAAVALLVRLVHPMRRIRQVYALMCVEDQQ